MGGVLCGAPILNHSGVPSTVGAKRADNRHYGTPPQLLGRDARRSCEERSRSPVRVPPPEGEDNIVTGDRQNDQQQIDGQPEICRHSNAPEGTSVSLQDTSGIQGYPILD